jgi:ABC-2 type transport system permease protein
MRLLSEEMRSGTIEVLMTAPVTDFEMVISKFVASLLFYVYLLAITGVHVGIVCWVGRPDYGPVITMYIGLLVLGAMFLSVGLLVSSFTRNQIVAAVVSFVALLLLFLIGGAAGQSMGPIKKIADFLSLAQQYETFHKGVVDTRHLIYSLTFTAAMLFFTVRSVEARKWR